MIITDVLKSQSDAHIGQIKNIIRLDSLVEICVEFLDLFDNQSFCFESLLVAEERVQCLSPFAMELLVWIRTH